MLCCAVVAVCPFLAVLNALSVTVEQLDAEGHLGDSAEAQTGVHY